MEKFAKLTIADKEYKLPLITGTNGEQAIDIAALRSTTGLITLDPGLANTGSSCSGGSVVAYWP